MQFLRKPAIEFPEQLRALGFTDCSYAEDGAALALRECTEPSLLARDIRFIGVWCAEERVEDREHDELTRYAVVFMEKAEDVADAFDAYSGEDLNAALAEVHRLIHGNMNPFTPLRTLIETVDRVGLDKVTREWPDLRLAYNQAQMALTGRAL